MDNVAILIQKEIQNGKKRSADVTNDAVKKLTQYGQYFLLSLLLKYIFISEFG